MNKSAIIFLPETGVYPYTRTLSLLGNALQQNDYTVYLVNCKGLLYRCPMMPNSLMPFVITETEKKEKCRICKFYFDKAISKYHFTELNPADYISSDDIKNIENILPTKTEKWGNILYDNCKIGQIAIHDLMIETKVLNTVNLNKDQQILYGNYIKTMAILIECTNHILKEIKPQLVLTFNPYAQCQAILHACTQNNIMYNSITNQTHLGSNCSLLIVSKHTFSSEMIIHTQQFSSHNHLVLAPKQIEACFDDAIYRMFYSDSHIFSSSKKNDSSYIPVVLSLSSNKKIIGVFTSSYDERLGIDIYRKAWGLDNTPDELFKSQLEWLKFLCFLARKYSQLQFIFRIHPREGLNGGSEHLKLLHSNLSSIPDNVKILWPENQISSYDLLEFLDLCLISHSTMGIECNRVGIPTISYVHNFSYPNEGFIPIPETIEEYEQEILKAVDRKISLNDMKLACRFYNWRTFIPCINFENQIAKDFNDPEYLPFCPNDKCILVTDILENKINICDWNIKQLTKAQNSKELEQQAVQKGIRKIIFYFFFSPNCLSKESIHYIGFRIKRKIFKIVCNRLLEYIPPCKKFKDFIPIINEYTVFINWILSVIYHKNMYFFINKTDVFLCYQGKIKKRFSPLLTKLILLCKENNTT